MIFQMYGLRIDVPREYYIIVWKGSHFFEGSVEVHDITENIIKMDWNNLNKFINTYKSPEDFFRPNLEKIKQDKDIRDYKLETYSMNFDENHPYYFHKISYKILAGFPKREYHDYLIGLGVFCMNTNRFILLQYRPPEKGKDIGDKALEIIKSFSCRCFE
ncbi:MAG: hypothetical protein NZ922_04880 [Candidatus Methanomethyliaceae archaeon]|nr:hypothetical protein [Candidatus Methanomethyliaceae archaeon]MDW7971377.1 hypothetical protein [Nitrososphaerota archaeon]